MSNGHAGELGNRRSLYWRLWRRSLTVRRPQAALAIGALLVGATVSSMLLNLYHDVLRKMTQEFRSYGANVVLTAPSVAAAPGDVSDLTENEVMPRLKPFEQRLKGLVAVPILSAVVRVQRVPRAARLEGFENVVAVGADFSDLRRLYPSWRVEGGAGALEAGACALGARLASRFQLASGDAVELAALHPAAGLAEVERKVFRIASLLSTGGSEDDQVFVPLAELQRATGLENKISLVQLSVPGETAEIERAVRELSHDFPGLDVRPVRQIVYSEGKVLETIRWLLVSLTALIVITIALCVAATMTAIVLERRKDIAIMKALGATDRLVMKLFLTEGASLGLLGGVAGFVLGVLLARGLAERLFGVSLNLSLWTLPLIAVSSMLLAALATVFPVKIVREVRPAAVLQGE